MNTLQQRIVLILFSALVSVLVAERVEACHTPDSAAFLGKKYEGKNFVQEMHDAHMNQPRFPYQFKGAETCTGGMVDIFPCSNIELVGFLDLNQIGGGSGSDSWGWKHEASNRYFALVGRSNGTAFVEITDPANPVYVGNLPSDGDGSSAWRDIKTYQDHAYIVSDFNGAHGMQVFDLSLLLTATNLPVTFSAGTVYRGTAQNPLTRAHNIVINETSGFAYAVGGPREATGCQGGLHMINIQTPASPSFAGCFSSDGYTHDAQCVIYSGPDADYSGREICFASNEDTVTVVDVTDKKNPVLIERASYALDEYTHQGWLDASQRYFVFDDELDERMNPTINNTRTHVIDFNDLDNPVYTGFFEADGPSIDHNQYIFEGRTYQANYNRGLRILELGDLSSAEMTEVSFIDTFPSGNSNQSFGGAWNVFPFFDNGLVLISDINRGILIVRPDLPNTGGEDIFSDGFEQAP